jgi:hypothetical protein
MAYISSCIILKLLISRGKSILLEWTINGIVAPWVASMSGLRYPLGRWDGKGHLTC